MCRSDERISECQNMHGIDIEHCGTFGDRADTGVQYIQSAWCDYFVLSAAGAGT